MNRWPVTEQELLTIASAGGTRKVSRAAQSIAKFMPQLTHDQYDEFWRWAIIEELATADPGKRRELLRKFDACPCCNDQAPNPSNGPSDYTVDLEPAPAGCPVTKGE